MKYSIVIPTYNHCDDLLKPCIESIFKFTTLSDIELIIVANGCKDETKEYFQYLHGYFKARNLPDNIKTDFYNEPLGYSKSTNIGIRLATTDKIVLLNNDIVLLDQPKDTWLNMLDENFIKIPTCGISCVIKSLSEPAGQDFAIFFCVMIKREVFDKIGLLNEEYGKGGGEDTEFSIEAVKAGYTIDRAGWLEWSEKIMLHIGSFPIYHKGEGTVHDVSLVPDWKDVFLRNTLKLALKYNKPWYDKKMHEIKIGKKLQSLTWMRESDTENLMKEVIDENCYEVTPSQMTDREVIDIGANMGAFTVMAACMGAKKVLAVEPVGYSYDRLMHNIGQAGITDKVTVFRNLVTDKAGEVIKIGLHEKSGANNIYNVGENFEAIATITLKNLMKHLEGNNVFLKIDCEGGEYDIILKSDYEDMKRVTKISMEIHSDLHPVYKGYEILHTRLKELGFTSTNEKQIFSWMVNEKGERYDYKEIPYRIEIWERK